MDGDLPPGLVYLDLGHSFNQSITPGTLPTTLKNLVYNSTHPIRSRALPASLETLELGLRYNHPLDNGVLPQTIKSLLFVRLEDVEDADDDVLPGQLFNHPLGILPSSLTDLRLPPQYGHAVVHAPLKSVLLTAPNLHRFARNTYPNITSLDVTDVVNVSAITSQTYPSIRKLNLSRNSSDDDDDENIVIDLSSLPNTIDHLVSALFSATITAFPKGLTKLELWLDEDSKFRLKKGMLPDSITSFSLYGYEHEIGSGVLPTSLTELSLYDYINEFNLKVLPLSLRSLVWTTISNQSADYITFFKKLPSTIVHLTLQNNRGGRLNLMRLSSDVFLSHNEDMLDCGLIDMATIIKHLSGTEQPKQSDCVLM
ncbi:hypothetical protein SAMD00019534_121420 [Acytostelium subglobosum LB1]|uniref:hypothetical protein n=1 Tax=Acytostelium subglobosum LB1 TaxID=1410327 RepID=UPI000644BADD|nr:hypothetical protein SAMD00019534_121420 [Acytostelium subglobosum LB1]GAM28966.1 hypothetical protein SAMD00019534_121420 [Acytostelium subglobosum LB1]|eukprot:XP_012748151.1 hypothetical protein SAMD00019534_121420 [Acytostelium subglobosum LB1]